MRRGIIFAAMTLWSFAASAQSATMELTLEKAVEIALSENPTIKVADMEVERFDYVRNEYLGGLAPSISATGNYSRAIVKQKLGGSIDIQGDNTFAGGASLSLPLFAPSLYATLKLTKEQMAGAVETARASRITIVNEVTKGFYNILLASQSLDVLYASRKTISETVENTRAMLKSGLASEYDLITAEVQLSNLTPSIIQTESSIKVAKMMLKMYLSIPEEVDIKAVGTLDTMAESTAADNLTTDVSGNSDLRAIEINERILGRQLKLSNTKRLPTIAAFGDFTFSGQDFNLSGFAGMGGDAPVTPSKNKYTWTTPFAVGVSISVPIFSGFSNNSRAKQLKNSMKQLSMQRDYLGESLNVQVRSAISDVFTAREKMSANVLTVSQSQKAYSISQTRYKAGAGTMLELNSSELAMTQAKLNYTQSVYEYLASLADYRKIVGDMQAKQ